MEIRQIKGTDCKIILAGKLTPNTFPLEPVSMLASVVMMLSISRLCLISHLEGNYMRLKAQEKNNKLTLS